MSDDLTRLAPWITGWGLEPDGDPFATGSSLLLAVRHAGDPAFLKLALEAEEKRGGAVMRYYGGRLGAAQVIVHDDDAVLLERLDGPRSLAAMAGAARTRRRAVSFARSQRRCRCAAGPRGRTC
jgi:streptomycin 6-kinase